MSRFGSVGVVIKKVLILVIALLVAGIVFSTASQVISRYVFSAPFMWTEELARYLGIWCVMLTAGFVLGENMHIGIEVLIDKLSGPFRKIVFVFNYALIFLFSVYLVIYGFRILQVVRSARSAALRISMGYVYAAVPAGAIVIAIYALLSLFRVLRPTANTTETGDGGK